MQPASPVLPGHNCEETVYAKDQPEYTPLPAVHLHDDPERTIITRWHLSDEERKRIAEGQDVYLWVLTFGRALQPVKLGVMTADEIMGKPANEEWPSEIE